MNILILILRAVSSLIPAEDAPSVLAYRTDKSEEKYQAWRLEREREVADFYNVDYRDIDDNPGCVSWMFEKKGYILVEKTKTDEYTLMSVALDAGAEDMKNDPKEDNFEVVTAPENLGKVRASVEESGIPVSLAEVTMLPKNYATIDERHAEQMIRLIEALEDHEDVQNVYTNFDVPEEVIARVEK